MSIDRKIWTEPFQEDAIPSWICPRCKKGILLIKPNQFKYFLTSTSKQYLTYEDYHPYNMNYRYMAILVCSNNNCKENVISTGEGFEEFTYEYDDFSKTQIYFEPKYFNPPLKIFNVPIETPKELKKTIYQSFELFFSDAATSLNKLRISAEILLNCLNIKKKDSKGNLLCLDQRIKELKEKRKNLHDQLMAIKFLGNAGSHSDNLAKICKEDVLDGYEIFSTILKDQFENKKNINEMISEINNNRGPINRANH